MEQSTLLFFSYAANLAVQAGDCYTTTVSLNSGKLEEGWKVSRWLISKIGLQGLSALKMGALPLAISFIGAALGLYGTANIANFGLAVVTLPVVIRNIMLMKKAKIKIF